MRMMMMIFSFYLDFRLVVLVEDQEYAMIIAFQPIIHDDNDNDNNNNNNNDNDNDNDDNDGNDNGNNNDNDKNVPMTLCLRFLPL